MKNLIERQAAIDAINHELRCGAVIDQCGLETAHDIIEELPSAQPEPQEIGYTDCANAMLKMWIDNVVTDGEYSRIMDKLNAHWAERRAVERSNQQTGIM